jgi:hypothetical protein
MVQGYARNSIVKSSPTSKWIVDAALLVGYCVAVWIDLTGLELHQWIGVGVGLLAGYHLLTHMDWVTAVTRRLFGKTSPRARLYYLIDVLMLGGFVAIGVTGLLISTWLNLTLGGMATLAAIHKWTAYLTLAAVFVKLALHWRWIVSVAGKFFAAPAAPRANAGLPAAAQASGVPTRSYTRRETLRLMGAAALSTAAVVGVASKALGAQQASDNGSTSASAALATATTPSATPASVSVAAPTATTAAAAPTATTAAAAPTATTVAAAPTATSSSAASLACLSCRRGKHCSYPGDCRDYVDTNGNNRCDRGECA